MGRTTGFLTKDYTATVAVPKLTAVKWGAADGAVVPAVDIASLPIGISGDLDAAIGERCSVFMVGNIADVLAGGTIARGDPLAATTGGKVITATANGWIVGYAEISGVSGDIISMIVAPSRHVVTA